MMMKMKVTQCQVRAVRWVVKYVRTKLPPCVEHLEQCAPSLGAILQKHDTV